MKLFQLSSAMIALAVGAVGAGAVWAASPPEMEHAQTRAEVAEHAAKLFDRLDANHDGKLDATDRAAMRAAQQAKMFDRMDANHDGSITREEFMAAHKDGHGDGPPPGPGAPPPQDGNGKDRMGKPGHEQMRHMAMVMMIMHQADPQHSGVVAKPAFVNAALQLFDMADTNHDGTLTPEERKAAQKKMRGEMREHWGHHGPDAMHGGDMPPPPPPGN